MKVHSPSYDVSSEIMRDEEGIGAVKMGGRTALGTACENGMVEVVGILIKQGVDVNVKDKEVRRGGWGERGLEEEARTLMTARKIVKKT